MTDERVAEFLAKFDAADADHNGTIDPVEFQVLFADIMDNSTEDAASLYFRGIDINGDGVIDKDEFEEFVRAALENDQAYSLKLVFRAFDEDRSYLLEAPEIRKITKYVGHELDDAAIAEGIQRITGTPDGGLSFAQVVKLLLDLDIPADADPYDGKLEGHAPPPRQPPPPDDVAPPAEEAPPAVAADAKPEEKKSACCLLL
jgi:Ca2+-binding EF-hand superfamily protein